MKTLPFIDLHQDLLLHIRERERFGQNLQTDFGMIKRCGGRVVTVTAFPAPPNDDYLNPITNDLIERDFLEYRAFVEAHPNWHIIKNSRDLKMALVTEGATTGLILHIEGLNAMTEKDFPRLEKWFDLGWRSLGPVWNVTNSLGGGTTDPTQGLTALGRTMIEWLQERHMIVDFAHMNTPTFWDAAKIVKGPMLVSHGNACALCNNPRNYNDEQLQAIAKTGGVIGVFFAKTFVTGRDKPGTLMDAAHHIDYLNKLIGIDHIALGTDFGGIITGTLSGLDSPETLPALWEELARRGYTDDELECIAWKNAARVLTAIL